MLLGPEFETHAVNWVLKRGLASAVVYKEMFLSQEQISGARQAVPPLAPAAVTISMSKQKGDAQAWVAVRVKRAKGQRKTLTHKKGSSLRARPRP